MLRNAPAALLSVRLLVRAIRPHPEEARRAVASARHQPQGTECLRAMRFPFIIFMSAGLTWEIPVKLRAHVIGGPLRKVCADGDRSLVQD